MLSTVLSLCGECLPFYVRLSEVIFGGGAVIYVGRYVEYVNPTPPLLNSSEIGAVYDSQPSGVAKPLHKWEKRGYRYLYDNTLGMWLTFRSVITNPVDRLLQIRLSMLLQIRLKVYYKSC